MKRICIAAALAGIGLLTGCGTTNNYLSEKRITTEYVRIFDIQTTTPKAQVINLAQQGLGRNAGKVNATTPIVLVDDYPATPARMQFSNPLAGSCMSAFVGDFKVATCEGAVWKANATKEAKDNFKVDITACLFPYKGGYSLSLYGSSTKREGGLLQMSRDMANAMVGGPEAWTEKTLMDVVKSIKFGSNANIVLKAAEPEIGGIPWLDKYDN